MSFFETMPSSDSLQADCKNGVAAGFEMLDIADQSGFALRPAPPAISSIAPFARRAAAAKIFAVGEQQIEREEDQIVGLAVGKRGLQRRKIRRAIMVERDDLAVDQRIGELRVPVFAIA